MSSTLMDGKAWFNKDELLTTKLIARPEIVRKDERFWSSPDPVAWVIRKGAVLDPEGFYEQLAAVLDLPFSREIPVPINPIGGLLPKLSVEKMARELVFHQQVGSEQRLYIANPFLAKTRIAELQKEIGGTCRVYISPHGEIKHALSYLNAYSAAQQVESSLRFARPELASQAVLQRMNWWLILSGLCVFSAALFFLPALGFGVFILVNCFYFLLNPLKVLLHFAGQRQQVESLVSDQQLSELDESVLPYYTLIVPLKHEQAVVSQLLNSVRALDYPIEKLDIKLAVEADDQITLSALTEVGISDARRQLAIPENILYHLVKVPPGPVSTKPRSCNFALQLARGDVTVIYDAEDKPDPLQLKKAWTVLFQNRLNTLCVQAKLTYYNQSQNLLTRFFTLEYGFWFGSFLPGLQALGIPFPLGGTSNHFITQTLKKIGGWDSHNVTEDADLGWRMNRFQYETAILDSYTYEEAMSSVWGWIKQRTRWQKGFLMTVLVHAGEIRALSADLGWWRTVSSVVLFTSVVVLPLINPLLWMIFLGGIVLLVAFPEVGVQMPGWVWWMAVCNLVFGNVSYVLMHVLVVFKERKWELLPVALLLPLYWPLLSVATFRAVWQLLLAPDYWEKSEHGLS